MIEIAGLALLRPYWLFALVLVAAMGLWFRHRATALGGWERAVDPPLLGALEHLGQVLPGPARVSWAPITAAALLAIALSGPATQSKNAETFQGLDGLVFLLDLSPSISEGAHFQEMLTNARLLSAETQSRRQALLVFGGDAYLANQLSHDSRSLGTTIALLDGGLLPDPGSRPERAIAQARSLLANASVLAGDLVLFSDGGGLGAHATSEAEAALAQGYRLHSLFVPGGDEDPESAAGARGLAQLADRGGGVSATFDDTSALSLALAEPATQRLGQGAFTALVWEDYGRYLLFLVLPAALLLFRRGA